MKRCSRCLTDKSLSDFYFNSYRGNYESACKICFRVRVRQWAARNPEKRREAARRHKQTPAGRLGSARYRVRHREDLRARYKVYYEKNRDQITARTRSKRALNPEPIETKARWRAANRAKVVGYAEKHRALKKGLRADLTDAQWQEVLNAWSGQCAYCGRPANSQDHLTPVSRGGEHTIWNVVPACLSCNHKKSAGPPLRPVQIRIPG